MPVNFRDVEMLQSSMRGLGDSFQQNRLERDQRKQRDIENELRQRMLTNQEKALTRADEGQTEAWLTGDDGGLVHYKGTPGGLQKVMQGAQQQGKTLKLTQPPKSKASIGSFSTSTPLGDFTFHMDSPEDVDKVMEQAKKIGGAKRGGEFKTAPIANAEHLASLQSAVTQAQTPEEKSKAEQALQTFQELVKASKIDPEAYETVTEVTPATKETTETVPGKKNYGAFGIDWLSKDEPDTEKVIPAQPEKRVSFKRKVGEGATPTQPTAAQPAPNAGQQTKRPTRAQAREYVQKYGPKALDQLKTEGYDVSGYAD